MVGLVNVLGLMHELQQILILEIELMSIGHEHEF